MTKMLDVLSKTNHRYIVSTGLIGEEYELSDNMHGEKYVILFRYRKGIKFNNLFFVFKR